VSKIAGSVRSRGFFFTLNQDLLVERACTDLGGQTNISAFGLRHQQWFTDRANLAPSQSLNVQLPTENECPKLIARSKQGGSLAYVKLHGSINWKSSTGDDCLVIGDNKSAQIEREPLLRQYFNLFKKVLNTPGARLVVVGYGFRDCHVNKAVAEAVRSNGLKLFLVSPSDIHDILPSENEDKEIIKASVEYQEDRLLNFYEDNSGRLTAAGAKFFNRLMHPGYRNAR
jgi:hypothetical protein